MKKFFETLLYLHAIVSALATRTRRTLRTSVAVVAGLTGRSAGASVSLQKIIVLREDLSIMSLWLAINHVFLNNRYCFATGMVL